MNEPAEAQRWRRLTELFEGLVELPAAERSARLEELGVEDAGLRSEVEELLSEADRDGVLDAPASEALATLLEELEEPVHEFLVGTRIGAYRLVEELGRGGMGVVYLAERVDGQFEQRVALKLVKRGLDTDEVLARFRRERQILARLDHRSIAKLFDGGATEDGRPYFAMEHVTGEPITAWCDARRLSIEERLKLFRRVCEAAHHAHRHLVVHRDLKPSNILVTAEGDLKLLDFGVAKLLGSGAEDGQATPTLTRVGLRAMTPEYAAPEQVLGGPVSTATDVYALGVVLYELLTGRRPYRLGKRFGADAERTILEVEPERPSAVVENGRADELCSAEELARARGLSPGGLRRRLTGDLDAIVLTALRKEPERRYGSAQALGEDLGRHLSGEPVSARPEGWLYRTVKFSRRHRAALTIVGAVLGLVLAASVVERGRRAQRREIVTQHLARGMELAAEGDALGALPWLARALELEPDARARQDHRLRIGTLLEYAPRLVRQWSHAGPVVMARFSADGTRVVTASEDGTARVWSVTSGQALTPPLRHEARLTWAEFSPDGREVLTAAPDGSARLWNATTGVLVRSLVVEDDSGVRFAAFSPDGSRILTGGTEGEGARLWDRSSGTLVAAFPEADQGSSNPRFDREGRRFVTASSVEARVWEAETGGRVGPPFRPPEGIGFNGATLSPDGKLVAVTPIAGTCATVWDAATGTQAIELCRDRPVQDAFFDPAGRHLVVGYPMAIWDLVTASWIEMVEQPAQIQFALLSRDGGRLLLGRQSAALVWEVGGNRVIGPLRHAGLVRWADLEGSGRFLLTASEDGTARLWDLAGVEVSLPAMHHGLTARGGGYDREGRRVLVISGLEQDLARGGYQQLWDLVTGEPVAPPMRHDHGFEYGGTLSSLFSPDGRRVLSGAGRSVVVWSAEAGEPLVTLALEEEVTWVAFSPDGSRIATGGRVPLAAPRGPGLPHGIARIWDAVTGVPVGAPLTGLEPFLRAGFSPDGGRLAVCGDQWITLAEAASGRVLAPPRQGDGAAYAACGFSPDGRWLLTAGTTASLRDGTSGEPRVALSVGSYSSGASFSAAGDRFVTGVRPGGMVTVRSVPSGGALTPLLAFDGQLWHVDFSPDDRWVLGAGAGARVWDAASGALLAALAPTSWTAGGREMGGIFLPTSDGVHLGEGWNEPARSWIWRFARDERPVEELIDLASLLAGYRMVSTTSGPAPLTGEELQRLWELEERRRSGAPAVPSEKVLAWHCRRAEELAFEGRHTEAVPHFDAVVEQGPPRATVFEWRGHTCAELGRLEEAEADFVKAADLRPGFPDLWSHAALVRLARGDTAGQRQICSDLLREWGTTRNPDRAYWIAHTCALVADGADVDREPPVSLADVALPLSGLEAEVADLRGASLYRAGRYEEARDQLLAAVESRDGAATAWEGSFLAMANARLGEPRLALQWLERGAAAPLIPSVGSNSELRPWKDRLEADALLAEARAVLGVEPGGAIAEARQ